MQHPAGETTPVRADLSSSGAIGEDGWSGAQADELALPEEPLRVGVEHGTPVVLNLAMLLLIFRARAYVHANSLD